MKDFNNVTLVLEAEKLVDPEARLDYAEKVLEVMRQLTAPSSAGYAFTTHQRTELRKLLLVYKTDLLNFDVYGSDNPREAATQRAAIEARIELLNFLINS